MALKLKDRFEKKFDEEIRFFKGVMQGPKSVGAIVPTSMVTAKRMAAPICVGSGLPVLELGPGTGVITKAILARGVPAEKVFSIEYSSDFYDHLAATIPDVNFIHGDAFDLDGSLGEHAGLTFDCVISAVPLLRLPMEQRIGLIEDALSRVPPGRPFVQITYSPVSPVIAKPESYVIEHLDFVMRNIPPAQLWVYRKP
ncbi:phospholipid N-methyltransferase PmtA [Rhizobium halophytocola]|uniref:Phosphatidylethanolamine/phosphatidyl-N-methylethanolamine N-methyltransferase n=1 Tax=Rhizobium halophytocola TaxID=735519 RepID=A0ABS4E0D7_9HYPH|nr:class I SAM-dependent methyltransferase [Rhizobium halophytocola]MBP1851403.1 phosphatidylethanolamine/phosphatidyl-N-methylethanolamine N-methyltransferase [Rhizobium halophytocola]